MSRYTSRKKEDHMKKNKRAQQCQACKDRPKMICKCNKKKGLKNERI